MDTPEVSTAKSELESAVRNYLAVTNTRYTPRWNIEIEKDAIVYCTGDHDKFERCAEDKIPICEKQMDVYKHLKRGSLYRDVGDARLQVEDGIILEDGDILKVYIDEHNELWVRRPSEFHDGRFVLVEENPVDDIPPPQQEQLIDTDLILFNAFKKVRAWYDSITTQEKQALQLILLQDANKNT